MKLVGKNPFLEKKKELLNFYGSVHPRFRHYIVLNRLSRSIILVVLRSRSPRYDNHNDHNRVDVDVEYLGYDLKSGPVNSLFILDSHDSRCKCQEKDKRNYVNNTGCPKSHASSLTRCILRYGNSVAIKELCLYTCRVTLHNFCDTKLDPIDNPLNELA